MIEKIRPNAIYLGTIAAILAGVSIYFLFVRGSDISSDIQLLLAAGAGACIGGLLTLAGQCATDPEPNPIISFAETVGLKVVQKVD